MEMVVVGKVVLGKMADFGEQKENCNFSGLTAQEGKTFISKF